jgi:hypothetical protein
MTSTIKICGSNKLEKSRLNLSHELNRKVNIRFLNYVLDILDIYIFFCMYFYMLSLCDIKMYFVTCKFLKICNVLKMHLIYDIVEDII